MSELTVLVIGASGGVGRAVAQRFVDSGARVHAGYRNPAARTDLVAIGCRPVPLDTTDDAAVASLPGDDIDVLVDATGVSIGGPLEELPIHELRRQLETNVVGMLRVVQRVVPGMRRRRRGRIVTVSSVAGRITMPGMGAYAASKHALEAACEALRYELAPFGVGVSVIVPGGIATPFVERERQAYHHGLATGPYAEFTAAVAERLADNPSPLSPERVAAVIHHAATTRRPRPTYRVGAVALLLLGLHDVLPHRAWRTLVPRISPTPTG